MKVESGQKVAPKVGNAMPLKNVPLGPSVHNIEIRPGSGGKVARAAGQQAIVSNREAGYALIKICLLYTSVWRHSSPEKTASLFLPPGKWLLMT